LAASVWRYNSTETRSKSTAKQQRDPCATLRKLLFDPGNRIGAPVAPTERGPAPPFRAGRVRVVPVVRRARVVHDAPIRRVVPETPLAPVMPGVSIMQAVALPSAEFKVAGQVTGRPKKIFEDRY
jgi:hypothetical protein